MNFQDLGLKYKLTEEDFYKKSSKETLIKYFKAHLSFNNICVIFFLFLTIIALEINSHEYNKEILYYKSNLGEAFCEEARGGFYIHSEFYNTGCLEIYCQNQRFTFCKGDKND